MAFHAPLLRCLASSMIADDGPQPTRHVVVTWCEKCFDHASELYRDAKTSQFHYVEPTSERVVSLGISPSWGDICTGELGRRGVPARAVSAISGAAREPWGIAHSLQAWLRENPDARVLVLCNRLESGAVRFAFSAVLSDQEFRRVAFWCPPDPRFDESNWWRSGDGRRELVTALFTQVYFRLHGEDAGVPATAFDPDVYERELN